MESNTEKLVMKTLAYLIKCDLTRSAISNVGAANGVNKTSLSAMIYDCVTTTRMLREVNANASRRSR